MVTADSALNAEQSVTSEELAGARKESGTLDVGQCRGVREIWLPQGVRDPCGARIGADVEQLRIIHLQ